MAERSYKAKADRVFSSFSPFIRGFIYKNGWESLRDIQIDSAITVFETQNNLLISSETASGKTEAALFPVLSLMERESCENFQVLYISPLKSLINDQYSRTEELLSESGMPVHRWHGDVNQSQKNSFLKNPSGILQITPESLESMLIRRHADLPFLFGNLKFVIIDEVHALMGSDRGNQILCQLQRIAHMISYQPRRIALSATLGDPSIAAEWLSRGSDRKTDIVCRSKEEIFWKLGLEHFFTHEGSDPEHFDPAEGFIYRATKSDRCVIFSNSREETEDICASMRQIAEKKKEEDRFLIHHGNLSASIREETEQLLKEGDKSVTVCATVTLELGIDIGKLRRIINCEAPTSVSGFLQRLGRSGRRGQPPEMLMVFREEEPLPGALLHQIIPWQLLQGIAIVELYRKERWIEPAELKKKPFSLLFHQVLSVLSVHGSLSPADLAKAVLSLAPFEAVTKEEFRELLIHMLKEDYLQRTEDNELMVGLKGERLTGHFKFYAVFKDSEDFTVRCGSEEIGTIATAPPVGEHFALAGKVWEVEEVELSKRLIFCKRVSGKMKVSWPGDSGLIHTKILEKMREILLSEESFPYLLPAAAKRLENARALAKSVRMKDGNVIGLGGNSFVIFPWLGTKEFQTLRRLIRTEMVNRGTAFDLQSLGCYCITLKSGSYSAKSLSRALSELSQRPPVDPRFLISPGEFPAMDKFDPMLPLSLVQTAYAENRLAPKALWEHLPKRFS
ncbi:MAG: DEAD/DEAH box helicase [Clostridia bacterium]|nr:DEAD/DEAH box helicase [Clostridia bacterium]